MKGCIHDHTTMEDECTCIRPIMHTNSADAGLPHTSLTDHIADLEGRMSQIAQISGEIVIMASDTPTTTRAALIRALAT